MFRIGWRIALPSGKYSDEFYMLCDDVYEFIATVFETFSTAEIVEVI